MDRGSRCCQLSKNLCRVDTHENVVLLNKRALVDTQFGDTAGIFGCYIDALDLDAAVGTRQTRWHTRCLLLAPVGVAASCAGSQNDNGQDRSKAHDQDSSED